MKTLKTILSILFIPILFTIAAISINMTNKSFSNVKRVEIVKTNPNRIIKSTYDVKYNLYCVLYIEDGDTVGLDHIYPIELDSLINDLNK